MRLKIQKWGNSLALRIPKSLAIESNIEQDSSVDLRLVDGKLIISPAPEVEYTLEKLLEGITDKNIHDEVDVGRAVGKEVW